MAVTLDGLHPTLMRPRVEALLADPEAKALGLHVVSAFRSIARQQQLWDDALRRYGDPEIADDWVARPGTSNHGPKVDGHGTAVDLGLPGVKALSGKWPAGTKAIVDRVAARHGLASPMKWEDWHFEPIQSWRPPAAATAPTAAREDLLMAAAKDDNDARAALIVEWFDRFLGRVPSDEELAAHLWVFARDGARSCVLGIARSPEAAAHRKRKAA